MFADPSGSAFVLQDPKNNYFAGPKENHKTLVHESDMLVSCSSVFKSWASVIDPDPYKTFFLFKTVYFV